MKTQHTPGPWKFERLGDFVWSPVTSDRIADINGENAPFPEDPEVRAANARLIASAPAMLEALETAYLNIQVLVQRNINRGDFYLAVDTERMRSNLRNAIAEATQQDCEKVQNLIEQDAINQAKGL